MQQQGGQQAYYGGGYTQAQSGYSSSGYGKLFKFSYLLHIIYSYMLSYLARGLIIWFFFFTTLGLQ